MRVYFNIPAVVGTELSQIQKALRNKKLSGDGPFNTTCAAYLQKRIGAKKLLLVNSCTSALELSALVCNIGHGDEVIMPSFTFTSTANAFVLRGARPVFVDIREDTKNIDEKLIEQHITKKTKAIVPVHYAGVSCAMDEIMRLARKYKLFVIEDAAQGVNARYKKKYLGTIGTLGTYSFHESKNYTCGEGGALVINDRSLTTRAEIIREKGTNREQFYRGEVDKYSWQDIGSSYLLSELLAAYLYAQLKKMDSMKRERLKSYRYYYNHLQLLEKKGALSLPGMQKYADHNAHIFYIVLNSERERDGLMDYLRRRKISSVYHYLPLHTSNYGKQYGYRKGELPVTEKISARLLRLPMNYYLSRVEQDAVIAAVYKFLGVKQPKH